MTVREYKEVAVETGALLATLGRHGVERWKLVSKGPEEPNWRTAYWDDTREELAPTS